MDNLLYGEVLRLAFTRLLMFRIVGEAVSLLTKAAPGFNGRVTLYIESSLPYIFIKVTCGAARLLSLYHNTLDLLCNWSG